MTFDTVQWAQENDLPVADSNDTPSYAWVDLETTGLDSARDVILEFGMVLTNSDGEIIPGFGFCELIFEKSDHYATRLDNMDPFVRTMHENSGLLHDLTTTPTMSINKAQETILASLKLMKVAPKSLYIAGSTIKFDAGFLEHYAADFMNFLHHRDINNSTLKILCEELNPELHANIEQSLAPRKLHRVMADLADTLHEFHAYVDNFLFILGHDDPDEVRMPIQ